jgi:nitrate reductase beta subunit
VPPLSPIQSAAEAGHIEFDGVLPKIESLRIPVRYLANMLTAGEEEPVILALKRLMAMRVYMRGKHVDGSLDTRVLDQVGLSQNQVEEMYRYLAIANYEDRFVMPTSNDELRQADYYANQGQMGFSPGNVSSHGRSGFSLFPTRRTGSSVPLDFVPPPTDKESA